MNIKKTVLWSILESQRSTRTDDHGYPTIQAEAIDQTIDEIKRRVEEYLQDTADD